MTTLSVLIPVYNAAPYLAEALQSLLTQTRPADQIVIVNDGSTDGSLEILEEYAQREQRIEIYSTVNGGVSRARNLGLDHCSGDYIALMDADDRSLPERFARQITAMQKHQLDACGCALQTFGRKTRTIVYPGDDASLKCNYLFYGRTVPGPAAMVRRDAIKSIRFDENLRFAEDFGFFLSLLLQAPQTRLHNLEQPLYAYRTHINQASQRLAAENRTNLSHLLHTWLPVAGIEASRAQLDSHYRLWHEQRSLPVEELQHYLPLMQQLRDWLHRQTGTDTAAQALWPRLARLNSGNAEALARLSNVRLSLWQRLSARLRGA